MLQLLRRRPHLSTGLAAVLLSAAVVAAPSLLAGEVAPSPIPGKVLKRPLPEKLRSPKDRMSPSLTKGSIKDAWLQLPTGGSGCGDDLRYDYGVDGGMRNFFCRGLQVFSWKAFLKMAPVSPFAQGPHKNGKLNLKAERDFGRYNPAFVRWATTALIPGADDATLREATQNTYDSQMRTLARLYFEVDQVMSADPSWIEAERQFYLVKMDQKRGGWDVWEVTDLYHNTLGNADSSWGGNDPNHVRSATMWWLRRHLDGTAALWREGLQRLLETYDGSWLKGAQQKKASLPPKRAVTTAPEYR